MNVKQGFSEEVEVLWVVLWRIELWIDVVNVLISVLSVNHEVEHWLEVSLAHSDEVEIDYVPGIEHDWRVSWVHPCLSFIITVENLNGSNDELALVLHDSLVLSTLGDFMPVLLHVSHLVSVSDGGHLLSEGNNLWDLVLGVVLHLSELVVLNVELVPLIVVDVDVKGLVWLFAGHEGLPLGGHLELHVGSLDLVHLLDVLGLESLDLRGWTLLLHGLNELSEGDELLGVDKGLNFITELFSVVGLSELSVVFHRLSLEGMGVLLETHGLLLVDLDGEEFSGLLVLINGASGGDGGKSGELVHL